jgi:hypothetical protein
LQRDFELGAIFVDLHVTTGKFATASDEHLVDVPRATRLASHRFRPMSKALTDFVTPASDRLICHDHAALEKAVPRCRAGSTGNGNTIEQGNG